jgi:penicillin amidase
MSGRCPKGGSAASPMHAGYRASDYRVIAGARCGSWSMSATGTGAAASTRRASRATRARPHYRDLAPLWAQGDYVPMLYSREAIKREAQTRIRLTPGVARSALAGRPRLHYRPAPQRVRERDAMTVHTRSPW